MVALDTRHCVFPLTVDIELTTGVPKPGVAVTLPRLPTKAHQYIHCLEHPPTGIGLLVLRFVTFALCDVSECDVSLTVLTCCALNSAASLCSGDVACNLNWFRPHIGAPEVADPLLLISSILCQAPWLRCQPTDLLAHPTQFKLGSPRHSCVLPLGALG